MIKDLFPLNTFQQDAVLKRLNEISSKAASVEEIEDGDLENAKPLYWHSLTLKRVIEGSFVFYFDFIIINNSETPFTLESFINWLSSFETPIEIKIVQGYENGISPTNAPISYFKYIGQYAIEIYYPNLTTGEMSYTTKSIASDSGAVLTDNGVNKIN